MLWLRDHNEYTIGIDLEIRGWALEVCLHPNLEGKSQADMRYWAAPFPVDPALAQRLRTAGLAPALQRNGAEEPVLLLYDAPHVLLGTPSPHATVGALDLTLRQRLRHADRGLRPVALSRLPGLSDPDLQSWLSGGTISTAAGPLPNPEPLAALLTLAVLDARPDLHEAYLNLELKADLLGGQLDNDYISRLRRAISRATPDRLLEDWHHPALDLMNTRLGLKAAIRRIGKLLNLIDRHRQRLQCLRRDDAVRRKRMASNRLRLSEHHQSLKLLERRLAATTAEFEKVRGQLSEAQSEVETLRQSRSLHDQQFQQIQDELEQYYLRHHRYRWICQEVQREMRRAEFLLLDVAEL